METLSSAASVSRRVVWVKAGVRTVMFERQVCHDAAKYAAFQLVNALNWYA
jgi:hypothetical protein